MIKLGDYNTLTVVKEVDFGIYLDGGDEGEILMPKRYVPEGTKPATSSRHSSISTTRNAPLPPPNVRSPRWATSPTSKWHG